MPELRRIEARLHVADLARAVDFYTRVLGFTVDVVFPESRPVFAILIRDEVVLQMGGPDGKKAEGVPSNCTLWMDTRDVLELHASLSAQVRIEWGPEVYFYHRREFAVRDPDGHLIVFSEETDDPVTCVEE